MDTVYSFTPILNKWICHKSMPRARARHASVAVANRYVYVFGGMTVNPVQLGSSNLSTTQTSLMSRYPSITSTSDYFEPNQHQHLLTNPSNCEHFIPIVKYVKEIECYDTYHDRWRLVGQNEQPRLESRVVVIEEPDPIGPMDELKFNGHDDQSADDMINKCDLLFSEQNLSKHNSLSGWLLKTTM